jgi:hypothetical protein
MMTDQGEANAKAHISLLNQAFTCGAYIHALAQAPPAFCSPVEPAPRLQLATQYGPD